MIATISRGRGRDSLGYLLLRNAVRRAVRRVPVDRQYRERRGLDRRCRPRPV